MKQIFLLVIVTLFYTHVGAQVEATDDSEKLLERRQHAINLLTEKHQER